MKKKVIIVTLIVAALAAVPFLYAGPGGHARALHSRGVGIGHGLAFLGHLDQVREELDLSDAQVAQLKEIVKTTHEQNGHFREEMHGSFKEIASTLLTNPNDTAAAQAVLDRQHASEAALKANLLASASKALNVLTPEQRTKLALHLSERAQRWENRRR